MTYNEIMQKPGRRISPKVYYIVNEEKVELKCDEIILAKPFFNASLLGSVMNGLTLELKQVLPITEIYFSNTATFNGNSEEKIYGPYYLKEIPTFNADTKTYTHQLYDKFIRTMVDYKPITISYPTTLFNFFKQLCVECGFTTSITSLPNGSRTIEYDIFENIGFTFRDVFDDIGEATGTLFKINNLNIEKCSLSGNSINIDDDILKNQNIELGNHFGPINSVILSRSGDSDLIYKRDENLSSWNEFKICDNQLMNDNNRSDYLDELFNALYGIEYDLFDLELVGYGGFEPLQKITISTNGKEYYSYIFNNEQEFTQSYKENIYTELPEENEPNYKAADTTDQRINRAYIIVDKQNKIIKSVVEQTDVQNKKIAQVTQSVDELNSKIKDIADITISGESEYAVLTLDNINQSEPIRINIKPNSEDIAYLYPNSSLYPSDTLYLKNRKIRFTNKTTEEIFDYELPDNLWFYDNSNYDEFILDYDSQTCVINKKVGINSDGSKYLLKTPTTVEYDFPKIELTGGDYNVELLGYSNAYIFVRLMTQNIYTTQFATRAEVDSQINQTASSINAEVSLKLDSKEYTKASIVAKINDTTSEVKINADVIDLEADDILNLLANNTINLTSKNIVINGDNFSVDANGNLKATNAILNNAQIVNGSINISQEAGQTTMPIILKQTSTEGNTYVSNIGSGAIRFKNESYTLAEISAGSRGYGYFRLFNSSGVATITESGNSSLIRISNPSGNAIIDMYNNTNSNSGILRVYDSSGNIQVALSGQNGNIRCATLTQTSRVETKKNFEKFNNALDILNDIDIYKYHLKNQEKTEKKHIGVVIGKKYKYSSAITSLDENGEEVGIDLYAMTSLCLKAIKELNEKVEELINGKTINN